MAPFRHMPSGNFTSTPSPGVASSSNPPNFNPSARNQIKLATRLGAAPNPGHVFKKKDDGFILCYRAYQWTQGYDITIANETDRQLVLKCTTNPACTFHVKGYVKTFTTANGSEDFGWGIKTQNFSAYHNHAPNFPLLDLARENARRANLSADDPSLITPPTHQLRQIQTDPNIKFENSLTEFLYRIDPDFADSDLLRKLDSVGISGEEGFNALMDWSPSEVFELLTNMKHEDELNYDQIGAITAALHYLESWKRDGKIEAYENYLNTNEMNSAALQVDQMLAA